MTVVVGVDGSPRSHSAVQAGQVRRRLVPGIAGRALVDVARSEDASLVVLSARPDGAVGWKIGPAGRYVLRNSPCPVMVVPGSSKVQS